MLDWFRSTPEAPPPPDPSHPSASLPAPLEQSSPATQAGWRDHIEGALLTTWKTGSEYGSAIASGAIDVAGKATQGAEAVGRYGADSAGSAITFAGKTAQGAGEVAGFVGRYGADSAGSALTLATHAVSGVGRIGGSIIDLAVVSPASIASRTAATVADAAIMKPARAISRFVLIALGIVCGSAVAIAGFTALAMYFYHAGSLPAQQAPTIVVLPPNYGAAVPAQAIAPQEARKAAVPVRAPAGE